MLAAKKINDEVNIFKGLFTNAMFCSIWALIVVLQALMVEVGGEPMSCHVNGLTATQWGICLGVGASALLVNIVLKFVPDSLFPTLGDEAPEDVEAALEDYESL